MKTNKQQKSQMIHFLNCLSKNIIIMTLNSKITVNSIIFQCTFYL